MTKMAAMPIYMVKTLRKNLLQNQLTNLQTCHVKTLLVIILNLGKSGFLNIKMEDARM